MEIAVYTSLVGAVANADAIGTLMLGRERCTVSLAPSAHDVPAGSIAGEPAAANQPLIRFTGVIGQSRSSQTPIVL